MLSVLLSHNESSSHVENHVLEDAQDRPPTLFLTVLIVLTFVFVFAWLFFALPLLQRAQFHIANEMNPGMSNLVRLEEIRKSDEILSSYQNLGNGQYQIPIEQAMKDIVHSNQ